MRFPWRVALGLTLSAALLYWALHNNDWAKVAQALRGSSPALWAVSIVLSQCTFPLRARRWRAILGPVAPDLSFGPLWRSTAIGMMANNVLPGRIGELVRAYALTREEPRIRFTTALASLVVDRTFDAVIVLSLLAVALLDPAVMARANHSDRTISVAVSVTLAVVAAAFAVLYLAVFAPARIEAVVAGLARNVAPRWESRVRTLVQRQRSACALALTRPGSGSPANGTTRPCGTKRGTFAASSP